MPARVLPKTAIQISHAGVWHPACMECGWFPEGDLPQQEARRAAYEHNAEHHDGAGVEFAVGDLQRPWVRIYRRETRALRYSMFMVGLAFAAVIATGSSQMTRLESFTLGVLAFALAAHAFLAGRWWSTRQDTRQELEKAAIAESNLQEREPRGD